MISTIQIEEALGLHLPLIDVRSPGEYANGHIPGAHNIALFSDAERAHVGTVYKQVSPEAAYELGYGYVTPKFDWFVESARNLAPDGQVVVHCWRGGMRSRSFAGLLHDHGFEHVYLVEGGYKAYRHWVLAAFEQPMPLHVLGGYTGSGKTHLLHRLQAEGHQAIDLEGLAHHRGSAFGGIGQGEQPTVEQFENNLHVLWRQLDPQRPVWIEDESLDIGRVKLPLALFRQLRQARLIFLEIPKTERAKFLAQEYGSGGREPLKQAVERLTRGLGGAAAKEALAHLDADRYYQAAYVLLGYYDKWYLKGLKKRNEHRVLRIHLPSTSVADNVLQIVQKVEYMDQLRLTQYSHGAGCGCKISPAVLTDILHTNLVMPTDHRLLVGNESRDDAAVYDMGDGTAIISTTDFFTPIVDDPFAFGKIAATNAISDVYAMGGKPLLAIAILGWPVDKLPAEVAQQVLEGGRSACIEAGIALAGGHSIDSPEPIFGLAVTGQVEIKNLKRNDTATEGCRLYLTKPLGVGILTTAEKHGKLLPEHALVATDWMSRLNKIGQGLASIEGIRAMTDVTGFGLLGHLTEMCEGSKLSAQIEFDNIPRLPELQPYIDQKCIPGGTYRNWASYGKQIRLRTDADKFLLCDPQTSGGLLLAVEPQAVAEVEAMLRNHQIEPVSFGVLTAPAEVLIEVR